MVLLIKKKKRHTCLHAHTHRVISLCSLSSEIQSLAHWETCLSPVTIKTSFKQIWTEAADFEIHRLFLSTATNISSSFFFSLVASSFSTLLLTLPKGRHQRQGGAAPSTFKLWPLQTLPTYTSEQPSLSIPEGLFIPWTDSICNWQIGRERKELPRMAGAENSRRESSGALPMGHLAGKSVDESAQVAARSYKNDRNCIF